MRARPRTLPALVVLMLAILPAVAFARQFPGTDPNESVRANTPNDPKFDHCEPDDEDGPPTCTNVFDEQYQRFGFAPNNSQNTALYHNPTDSHVQRLSAQNTLAGRNPLGQVPGVSADRAWKYSAGDPNVQIAILDTGIRWERESLRKRIWLNKGELPVPNHDGPALDPSVNCSSYGSGYDANGDGAFNVLDYACDSRVSITDPRRHGPPGKITAEDLILAFSDGTDADGNGYVDDIAGWDFFDDDNNPFDASSYSSANNHGSGRAENAAEEGNDADGGIGVCPKCQIVPMRVWDTFVVDTNNFAQAALYAADNNIEVVEGAVGGLFNSSFARAAFDYAYRHGVFFAIVSSDLNTADHNIPTLYNESMMVQGTVADVQGLGAEPPQQVIDFFNQRGVPFQSNAPIGTWFRNSGTTQYGGHADIVMPAVTGSEATGQASGAAGLLASYARQKGTPLDPNEIKQLLTETAFDVTAPDTAGLGTPDPANPGWDQHFGYGLPDLGLAMERIDQGKIPPEALITSPQWFAPFNVAHESNVDIKARLSANRSSSYAWKLQWAPGIEPSESEFQDVSNGSGTSPTDATLGTIDLQKVRQALDDRVVPCPSGPPATGGSTCDPTAPSRGPGDKDPNEPAFTVRVLVTDSNGNQAEDRKVLFAYRDPTEAYKKDLGTGGEASERLFDLNGDNKLDTVLADSSGNLRVLNADGTPLNAFNNGQPVKTQVYANVHAGAPAYSSLDPPREVLRTPAIGDIDGDLEPEIVDSAGEHVYAWHEDGTPVAGFPVRLDPSFSSPALRTKSNHVKRGFFSSPVLSDLNGDGKLDIVAAALDQHVYAWDGSGNPLPGFPALVRDPSLVGAEIINTPAVGDINGDGKPEIVVPTNEFDPNPAAPQTPGEGAVGGFANFLTNVLSNVLGGSGRIYALDNHGNVLPGWPTKPNGIVPDALPLVGPGVDQVLGDVNGDGKLDVIGNVATGDVTATKYDGTNLVQYDSQPQGGENVDKSKIINLFENPIVANLTGAGPEVIKGGVTLNQIVNLGVAVGQNLPYNHVVQAWNARTGAEIPSFPQAVEDYQLLSSPSVADVSDAPGNEVVVGTGLYYVRDINAAGIEGTGFPKFTGGWIISTPAIGDVDGDGNLDVTALSREGFAFRWTTTQPACGTNDEWWTARHDEWSTGAYGTDTRPPGTPRNLTATQTGSSVALNWTAPGDDWLCGKAKRYRVIASTKPIQHPTDGTVVGNFDASAAAGGSETQTVKHIGSNVYFAVLYQDDAGNWGHLATARIPSADLSLKKADSPDPAHVGQPLTYTITVINNGPDTASGVTVDDPLPKSTGFGSASTTQGSCTRVKTSVTCNLGSLASGDSARVTILVKPTQKGTITNTATVASAQPIDPDKSNNSDTATTTVKP